MEKTNAPSQAHLQGTQSRHINPTLQKSLPCANASGTHPTSVDKYFSVTDQDEGRTHNKGFAKMGADGSRVSTFVFQFGFISSLTLLI